MPEVNVALIGYAFMGRAHSNAYRQVGPFFQPKLMPRMKVLCGRDRAAVRRAARVLGWEETATDWREVVERPDIDLVDVSTPGDSHADQSSASCVASGGLISAKRTPTPINRTFFPVRANASASRVRYSPNDGIKPARSTVVRVKSANFNFTKIFVTVRVGRSWEETTNSSIHAAAGRYANVRVADWYAASEGRPEIFYSDGIHILGEGGPLFAALVAAAIAS